MESEWPHNSQNITVLLGYPYIRRRISSSVLLSGLANVRPPNISSSRGNNSSTICLTWGFTNYSRRAIYSMISSSRSISSHLITGCITNNIPELKDTAVLRNFENVAYTLALMIWVAGFIIFEHICTLFSVRNFNEFSWLLSMFSLIIFTFIVLPYFTLFKVTNFRKLKFSRELIFAR